MPELAQGPKAHFHLNRVRRGRGVGGGLLEVSSSPGLRLLLVSELGEAWSWGRPSPLQPCSESPTRASKAGEHPPPTPRGRLGPNPCHTFDPGSRLDPASPWAWELSQAKGDGCLGPRSGQPALGAETTEQRESISGRGKGESTDFEATLQRPLGSLCTPPLAGLQPRWPGSTLFLECSACHSRRSLYPEHSSFPAPHPPPFGQLTSLPLSLQSRSLPPLIFQSTLCSTHTYHPCLSVSSLGDCPPTPNYTLMDGGRTSPGTQ